MIPLPPVSSPRALWRDMRLFFSGRSRHHWIAAALAVVIPATIATTFVYDSIDAHRREEQIIYVESWRADRSLEETIAQQREFEARRQAWEAERRRQFQRLDQGLSNMGI